MKFIVYLTCILVILASGMYIFDRSLDWIEMMSGILSLFAMLLIIRGVSLWIFKKFAKLTKKAIETDIDTYLNEN